MEEEKNKKYKKETACLFYNIEVSKKEIPISTLIDVRKNKMDSIVGDINNYSEKVSLTEKNQQRKDSYSYYRNIFNKYFSSQLNNQNKKEKQKIKPKQHFLTNSKIHFGNFINTHSYIEGYKKLAQYDFIKSKISKSKNFSFVKDPKTMRYKKLPLDLYISKEDSLKIKDLISVRLIPKLKKNKNENEKESLIRLSYDNGFFYTPSINFQKNNNNKKTNKKIFYINKNRLNEIHNIESPEKKEVSNLKNSINLNSEKEEDEPKTQIIKNKYNIHKNLSDLNDIDININQKCILNKQKNYSQTEYKSIYPYTKKILLSQLDKKIKNFKTPKKALKEFVKYYKEKSEKNLKKLNNLILKENIKQDQKLVIKDIKDNKTKINKKNLTKKIYMDIHKRGRFLSIVEKLKNIKRVAPMMLLNHLFEEYTKQSKQVVGVDPKKKKINNIYKSEEEGKLIKKKIEEKNNEINKMIYTNKEKGNNLKNKYEKFDLVIEKIKEENQENKYESESDEQYYF